MDSLLARDPRPTVAALAQRAGRFAVRQCSTICVHLVFAIGLLALAGCGGGTDGTPVAPTPAPRLTPAPSAAWPKFGKFTDSQGQVISYGLHMREEWDPTEPRGVLVFFHGNNIGTQEEMSRLSWFDHRVPFDLGLAVAYVGSPRSRPDGHPYPLLGPLYGKGGRRYWLGRDKRLVHELLQSGFDSQLAIDYDKVVFYGGSAGAAFVSEFFERYAGIYGGGLHVWCGGFWSLAHRFPRRAQDGPWEPAFPWTPFTVATVKDRVRVFVEATTGDPVHPALVVATSYYRDVLQLETRSDLENPGGHCSTGSTPRREIWEWLSRGADGDSGPRGTAQDADGDGLSNSRDTDDDNDGAPDSVDALPFDPRGYRDTDGDGIGDFEDRDADGDGVRNADDAFPSDPHEWLDTDADGIGNNIDRDDDNDGLADGEDPDPVHGTPIGSLAFQLMEHDATRGGRTWTPVASVHRGELAGLVYPEPSGDRQSFQYVTLGDGPAFQIMIDRSERKESCPSVFLPALCVPEFDPYAHYMDRIYVDRDRNGDLTDDGPPLLLARSQRDGSSHLPRATIVLKVSYGSGETLPYGISLWTTPDLDSGIHYRHESIWIGRVQPPTGAPVLVATVDWNLDGLFNTDRGRAPTGEQDSRDFACVDANRNDVLDECERDQGLPGRQLSPPKSVKLGETFMLDGRTHRIVVAPTGHKAEIVQAR